MNNTETTEGRIVSPFEKELSTLINRYSMENGSNTPDFLLAQYLDHCLKTFGLIVTERDRWYSIQDAKEASQSLT